MEEGAGPEVPGTRALCLETGQARGGWSVAAAGNEVEGVGETGCRL